MFTGFLVNEYADDVQQGVDFYSALGFEETFRTPREGVPRHVELRAAGLTVGISSVEAARDDHGVEVSQGGAAMGIVLWCEDVDAAYAQALAAGATALHEPHEFQGSLLRVGWLMDPLGNPLQLVQEPTA